MDVIGGCAASVAILMLLGLMLLGWLYVRERRARPLWKERDDE